VNTFRHCDFTSRLGRSVNPRYQSVVLHTRELGGTNMLRDCASVLGAKSRYSQPAISLAPD